MPSTPTTLNPVQDIKNKVCSLPDYCLLDEYWFEDLEYWLEEFYERHKEPVCSPDAKKEARETD